MLQHFPQYDRAGFKQRELEEKDWAYNRYPESELDDGVIVTHRHVDVGPDLDKVTKRDPNTFCPTYHITTRQKEVLTISKVEFEQDGHRYVLQDYVHAGECLSVLQYPEMIISGSALWKHVSGQAKYFYRGNGADLIPMLRTSLIEHFATLKGTRPCTYAERYERMNAIVARLHKSQRKLLTYVDTNALKDFETISLNLTYDFRWSKGHTELYALLWNGSEEDMDWQRLTQECPHLTRVLLEQLVEFDEEDLVPRVDPDRATRLGTNFHRHMELRMIGEPGISALLECDEDRETARLLEDELFADGMFDLGLELAAIEMSLGSFKHKICGQFDFMMRDPDQDLCILFDYKRADVVRSEVLELVENKKATQGSFSPKGPLHGLNIPPERKFMIGAMNVSSCLFSYAFQMGVYRKLNSLNSVKVSKFIYLVIVHPAMGVNYMLVEIDLGMVIKIRGVVGDDLTIVERVDLAFQKRLVELGEKFGVVVEGEEDSQL